METDEDGSTTYRFNDGSQNYLLHNGEDGLNDSYPVESIFTQLSSEWNSEVFPILLNSSLASKEDNAETPNFGVQEDDNEEISQNDESEHRNTLTVYTSVEDNGVFLSNDVLLKLRNGNFNQRKEIDEDTYTITYDDDGFSQADEDFEETNSENVEIIQLVNIDGSVTNINKDLLKAITQKISPENFYSKVEANKCKLCSFICESSSEIVAHINLKHADLFQQSNILSVIQSNQQVPDKNIVGTPMTSILNTNDSKRYTIFLCSICNNGYWDKENLKEHMIAQHNFKCNEIASNSLLTKDKIEKVENKSLKDWCLMLLKKQQKALSIKCSIRGCQLKFSTETMRDSHEACHLNQNKQGFVCTVCDEKFSIWRVCNMHLWKGHNIDIGLLTCPICNKFKGNTPGRILTHMAIHNEEKPFICSSCKKGFKQLTQLRNHEEIHKSKDQVPNWFSTKQCELCNRHFANPKSLKKHVKFVHEKFKPFICNICGHQTARKEMLQLHYRQHTGEKPFHCLYCEYKTRDRNSLRRHTMRHFGVGKYLCPYCSYQSIQSSSYKAHLRHKHPGKEGTFSCNLCKYSTVSDRAYLTHVKCHELKQKELLGHAMNNSQNQNAENPLPKQVLQKPAVTVEDDETQNCFLNNEHSEDAVDTGGITIPAELDLNLPTGIK